MPPPAPLPAVLTLLNSISSFSAAKIENIVDKLSPGEQTGLAAELDKVASQVWGSSVFGLSFSSWARPAQGQLMIEFQDLRALTSNPPSFNALSQREMNELLGALAGKTPQQLLDGLSERLSGKRVIAALSAAQSDTKRQGALNTWAPAFFTAPEAHSPERFTYLVHGLRRDTDIGLASAPPARLDYVKLELSAWIDKSGKFQSGQYYLENPDIVSKSLLSCSVITEAKTNTFANMYFGFILRVPKENIGAASSVDMNMGFDKATRPDMLACEPDKRVRMALISESFVDGVAALYQKPLPTLPEVVSQTAAHNEIAVIGSIGGSIVKVIGLFVKVSPRKMMLPTEFDLDEKLWSAGKYIRGCADRLGVPIAPIPHPGLEEGAARFAVQFGGR